MTVRTKRSAKEIGSEPVRSGERQWIEAAIQHLANANVDDIRIEELSRELGVTKGSFYWHFRSRDHLLDKVLEHWLERATIQVTRWAQREKHGPIEMLRAILSLPAKTPPKKRGADVELAVRSWARRDRRAAEMVRKVDSLRAEFFEELMGALGYEGEEKRRRAAMAQAFMLGEAFLKLNLSREERIAIVERYAELLAKG